ncbi:MAG TPA: hypothetical protein VJH96_00250 [Patescibacteria group bacterium]|nr:hypothetical protein [Patescibacteria group bacterium]
MILVYLLITFCAFWVILRRTIEKINNTLIAFSLIFFISTYVSVMCIFFIAIILSPFTSGLLLKASAIYLFFLVLYIFYSKVLVLSLSPLFLVQVTKKNVSKGIAFFLLFILIYVFFSRHLALFGDKLYTSYVYWDFRDNIRIVENFAQGDNFPPQNEGVSGYPNIYHYFWFMIPAIYQVFGLDIAMAYNFASSLALFFLLLTAMGIMKNYVKTRIGYVLLPLFILTHGSLKFVDDIKAVLSKKIFLKDLFLTTRPDMVDFNINGAFGYNGSMWNIFYFLNERQLIFATFALLLYLYILLHVRSFSRCFLIFLGIIYGAFFQWHIFITFMCVIIGLFYGVLCLFFMKKKEEIHKLLLFVGTVSITAIVYYVILRLYISSNPLFDSSSLAASLRINPFFHTMPTYRPSFSHFLMYYVYGYGIRFAFSIYAFYYFFIYRRKVFYLLVATVPIFIFINTVQFAPEQNTAYIYENHKLFRPFNVIMDIFTVTSIIGTIRFLHTLPRMFLVFVILPLTVFSGMISLVGYSFQRPIFVYADFNNVFYKRIRQTPPRSAFIADDYRYVFLAGRRGYASLVFYTGLKVPLERQRSQEQLVNLNTSDEICAFARENDLYHKVDFYLNTQKRFFVDFLHDCKINRKDL